ncbi:uncharacterized protein LOC116159001 [Photinus pyralis]|uniref:uncharacterized protein LOC116159001 n=1 Tax=Photinus pyralis TaxID=7054 RepID=UPI00126758A3|nr:uncharacterized protein LOC116159001 [Photinus pyralis]
MPKKKEKRSKKAAKELKTVSEVGEIDLNKPIKNRFDPNDPVLFDLTLPTFEKELLDQERDRVGKLNEKKSKEELVIDRRKKEIKAKVKEILKISPTKYEPIEPAIRDKNIIDVIMAQRSEKIVVKLSDGTRITLPLAKFDSNAPLYRGSGWTKETIEEEHHHGRETFSLAKLFEAKEQGVEEWELEMMRLANKRKKKLKGEDSVDWKEMLSGCLENMDWDKFEEDTKQIIDEKDEVVESEDIPMAVDDMEKTKNVNEKLKKGGEEVLSQLATMKEVPEVIKVLDKGELCELQEVSGIRVELGSGTNRFVPGQMVQDDERGMFVPGQTVLKEDGSSEYTPGITICQDDEPTLIPGLVMGEEESSPLFLPGDSTITEGGQLQFEATEEDLPPKPEPLSEPSESGSSSPSRSPSPEPVAAAPKPKPKKQEPIVIRRRNIPEPTQPVVKEKVKKRPPIDVKPKEKTPPPRVIIRQTRPQGDDPLKAFEERRRQEEEESKKRMKEHLEERKRNEEKKVDQLRLQIRQKYRNMKFENPPPYKPMEPVTKSKQLEELEQSIIKGTFFEDENTKKIMENVRNTSRLQRFAVGYSAGFNNYVGLGFGKYSLMDSGSRTLGVTRSYRVLVY